MNALSLQPEAFLALGFLALALATALGAARARSPLALALHMAVAGASLAAALASFGAIGAGLVSAVALGAAAPLLLIGAAALAPAAARLRQDGPPLASLAVALGMGLALIWAGRKIPALGAALPAVASPAQSDLLISVAIGGVGVAALGAFALLGFGERAESLRQPPQRRLRRHKLPEGEEPS